MSNKKNIPLNEQQKEYSLKCAAKRIFLQMCNKNNIPSNTQDSSVNWVDGNAVSTTPEGSYNNWFAAGDEHQPVWARSSPSSSSPSSSLSPSSSHNFSSYWEPSAIGNVQKHIIIFINTRWMNGSGRGALLFESEGRWSMKVALFVFTDIALIIIGEIWSIGEC